MPEIITREMNRDMILSPYRWVHVYLPLKKTREDGGYDVAVLRTAFSRGDVEFHIDFNLTIFGPVGPVERIIFPNVDALLDDGWVVD